MAKPTTIEEALLQTAINPLRARVGNTEAQAHSLSDLLEYQKYLDAKGSTVKKQFGLRMTKLVPPGAG